MKEKKEIDELRLRLKNVILETCNKIGCKNCDLKWKESCSAVELENRIYDLEFNSN